MKFRFTIHGIMELEDNYADSIPDKKLIYTSASVPCDEIRMYFDDQFIGCACKECNEHCECVKRTGIRYTNNCLVDLSGDKPLYECNSNCACNSTCGMKLVSKGPCKTLEVRVSGPKGHGVFANGQIEKGAFVCEYAGELLTEDEANRRFKYYNDVLKLGRNYIFWIKEHFGETLVTIIDPTRIGNIGRYINHSCEPNCTLVPVRVDFIVPKLCVFAVKEIKVGEEICFDYGCNENSFIGAQDKIVCLCGSENCRKYLPYHKF